MSRLQKKLLEKLKKKKVFALSINASGISRVGMPDILILNKDGQAIFVEIKEKGDRLSEIQKVTIEKLQDLGYPVFVVRNDAQLKEVLLFV